MDPQMDPARLILGNPYPKKALKGPHWSIFLERPLDNVKTAWLEVNPTFGSRDISFKIPDGPT